jgi:hypothetical protein
VKPEIFKWVSSIRGLMPPSIKYELCPSSMIEQLPLLPLASVVNRIT